jgi:glyoxylase-like metal-dependent hydrolase (beta-lactamase superfamily II)
VTNGFYNVLLIVSSDGVIIRDCPTDMRDLIFPVIAEVTGGDTLATHVIYSHAHKDHIGGSDVFGPSTTFVQTAATKKILEETQDLGRPVPCVGFEGDQYELLVGGRKSELRAAPETHQHGALCLHLPIEKVAMIVVVVFTGWAPFRSLGVAGDVMKSFTIHVELLAYVADLFVCGHLDRVGTREDIEIAGDYLVDLKAAGLAAL